MKNKWIVISKHMSRREMIERKADELSHGMIPSPKLQLIEMAKWADESSRSFDHGFFFAIIGSFLAELLYRYFHAGS